MEALVKEIAQRFGLGATAGPLINLLLEHVEQEVPGGWATVLERFRESGYGLDVATWLGAGSNRELPPDAISEVFGADLVSDIAHRAGVNEVTASEALAFAVPELIDSMSPEGFLPGSLPGWAVGTIAPRPAARRETEPEPEAITYTSQPEEPVAIPAPRDVPTHRPDREKQPKTLLGPFTSPLALAGIVCLVALAAWRTTPRTDAKAAQKPTAKPAVAAPAQQQIPATLTIRSLGSRLEYSGVVHDAIEQQRIDELMQEKNATGSLEVDLGVSKANWLPFLEELVRGLPRGLELTFKGQWITLAGLRDSELETWRAVLQDRVTRDIRIDVLDLSQVASTANEKALAAIERLEAAPDVTAEELVQTLNLQIINFRSGSVEVPEANQDILRRAASLLNKLDPNTRLEIGGYTDSSGSESSNLRLSVRRAEGVRAFLVEQGVDSEMLEARGYGEDNPIQSNDTEAGRFANRRIAFAVLPSEAP